VTPCDTRRPAVLPGSSVHLRESQQGRPLEASSSDSLTLSPDHTAISFSFKDHELLDGVMFETPDLATQLTLSLEVDGVTVNPDQVNLGPSEAHPASADPLVVSRAAS
jgi:hypothetical protein